MILKKTIPKIFRGTMSKKTTPVKEFPTKIKKRFVKTEKADIDTLLTKLISMRYKGKVNIRDYITKISHLASKLNALNVTLFLCSLTRGIIK